MATLTEPRASEPITFAVVADPHISTKSSGTRRLFHRTEKRLERAINDIKNREPAFVLVVGDLTKDGESHNFKRFQSIISDLAQPILAIPGNHDVSKVWDINPEINQFDVDAHFRSAYEPENIPFSLSLGDIDVIGLNSASTADDSLKETNEGEISAQQIEWLDDALERVENPVVAVHHPLSGVQNQVREHVSMVETDLDPTTLRNDVAVTKLLLKHDVQLAFTGHLHVPAIAETGSFREISCPATSTFPQSYLLVTISPQGTKIKYISLTDVSDGVEAFDARIRAKGSRGLTAFSSARLASFPLISQCPTDRD